MFCCTPSVGWLTQSYQVFWVGVYTVERPRSSLKSLFGLRKFCHLRMACFCGDGEEGCAFFGTGDDHVRRLSNSRESDGIGSGGV